MFISHLYFLFCSYLLTILLICPFQIHLHKFFIYSITYALSITYVANIFSQCMGFFFFFYFFWCVLASNSSHFNVAGIISYIIGIFCALFKKFFLLWGHGDILLHFLLKIFLDGMGSNSIFYMDNDYLNTIYKKVIFL